MSLASKVLVVLNLIFAVAFSIASVSLYAKKVNYVQELELNIAKRNEVQKEADAAKKKAASLESKLASVSKDQAQKIASLTEKYEAAENSRLTLDNRNNQLTTTYSKLDAEMSKLRSDLKTINKKKMEAEDRLAKVSEELQKAIDDRNFAQKTALEATADVKELEAEIESANKRAAKLLEENLEFKTLFAEVQRKYPDAITKSAAPIEPVRGRIIRIEEEVDLVIISVGENDKVSAGMEFIVSRGNDYIGKVKVRSIHNNICAAVINKDLTVKSISVGDIAETL